MCASMGAEGSVTLQLREAVEAPDSSGQSDTTALIGYPETDLLADIQGSIQATGNFWTDICSSHSLPYNNNQIQKSFHQYWTNKITLLPHIHFWHIFFMIIAA